MTGSYDRDVPSGTQRAFAAQSKYLQRTDSTSSLSRSPSKLDSRNPSPDPARRWTPGHRTGASIDQIQRRFGGGLSSGSINRSSSIRSDRSSVDFTKSTPSNQNVGVQSSPTKNPSPAPRDRTNSLNAYDGNTLSSGLLPLPDSPVKGAIHSSPSKSHHHKSSAELDSSDSLQASPLRSARSVDSPALERKNGMYKPKRTHAAGPRVDIPTSENTPPGNFSPDRSLSPAVNRNSSLYASPRTMRQGLRRVSENREMANEELDPQSPTENIFAPSQPSIEPEKPRTNSLTRSPSRSQTPTMPRAPSPLDAAGNGWRAGPPDSPELGGDEVTGLPGRVKLSRRPTSSGAYGVNELRQLNLQREHIKAYEYLCRVGEAQQWVDNCLQSAGVSDGIAPGGVTSESVVDLEQNLRNGVVLAQLARAFEGDSFVPKIFTSNRLEYRHTDNLNYFFRFLDRVKLPSNFHFETIDCYDGKNMPKVFYCIHSLSHHLARLGRADPVGKLWGHLQFTDEQLATAGKGIAGVHMPDFNGVGTALAKELKEPIPPGPVETEEEIMEREIREREGTIVRLQSSARALLTQRKHAPAIARLKQQNSNAITGIQAYIRAQSAKNSFQLSQRSLRFNQNNIVRLQSALRRRLAVQKAEATKTQLEVSENAIVGLQACARKRLVRASLISQIRTLTGKISDVVKVQAHARRALVQLQTAERQRLENSRTVKKAIVDLQSLGRARVTHQQVQRQEKKCFDASADIVKAQAVIRGILTSWDHSSWMNHLHANSPIVEWLQCNLKGRLCRRQFRSKLEHYQQHLDKVVKVQSVLRAKQQGEQYRQLRRGKNVPMSTIKNFIHLLDDSDYDYQEEIELERLRKEIVHKIRQNESLEAHVNDLDIKIALLVKNKITLDEVNSVRRRGGNSAAMADMQNNVLKANNDPFAYGNVDKGAHERLELYQELFYVLQTKPDYLAKLFCKVERSSEKLSDKPRKDLEKITMTLFGYAQNAREEYLLLKLLQRSLHEEMLHIQQVQDFLPFTFLFLRIFMRYGRGEKERAYIKKFLTPLVREVIEANDLDLETDPSVIYKAIVNEEEVRTGVQSTRPSELDPGQALQDGEARAAFIRNLQRLRAFSDIFLSAMFGITARIPFGVRYKLREIFRALRARFPQEDPDLILKVTGHSLYYRFIHPAIVNPETYDITQASPSPMQRKNLNEIGKMLNQVALGKRFSEDYPYLQPLNEYVAEASRKFSIWVCEVLDVDDAEVVYNADEFLDHSSGTQRPVIYISPNEIYGVHELIVQHLSDVAPARQDEQDHLRSVLQSLGGTPHGTITPELDNARSGTIALTLKTRGRSVNDPKSEERALFARTKRYVMALLKVQPGKDLFEVLGAKVTDNDEEQWIRVIEAEQQAARRRKRTSASPHLNRSPNPDNDDVYTLTFTEVKARVIEGIMRLESSGLVTRENNFQDILSSVATDIRSKHQKRVRREAELANMHNTMGSLGKRKEYLDDQIRQYGSYIESSMANMQKKGKKRLVIPFSAQYFHLRDLEKKGKVPQFGSYKYTAQKLYDKGVLLNIDQYATKEQYGNVTITISSDEVGVFEISISHPGKVIPEGVAEVRMDDLLNQQFNNQSTVEIKTVAKCNLNLLLHLINRKFYR